MENRSRLRAALAGVGRAVPFLLLELGASIVSLVMLYPLLFLVPLTILGVGWLAVPYAARGLRWWAGLARRRTARFTGRPVSDGYPPLEGPLLDQLRTVVRSRSTAVSKHIRSIFAKLGLYPEDAGHRRVLAVLAHLRS